MPVEAEARPAQLFLPSDDDVDMTAAIREADEDAAMLNDEAYASQQIEQQRKLDQELQDPNNPHVTLSYYKHLFPFKQLYEWLNFEHIPTNLFTHREFAFTLAGDIYLRYNSFNGPEDWKKETCRLNPVRFEVGPVYTARPRDKRTINPAAFKPVQRELIFDIDMTDYDDVRTCCIGKGMCKNCWGFIAGAVKVLDTMLRDDFGYQHLLWVYSGRRGIHCWISDENARMLSDEQRRTLVNYIEVIKGGANQHKKVNLKGDFHPSIERALNVLKTTTFPDTVLDNQRCFETTEQSNNLLKLLPDQDITERLTTKWAKKPCESAEKWDHVIQSCSSLQGLDAKIYQKACAEAVLQYTYPRIDTEVSKHQNHLLKSPFCIHPGTGKICVPVDPSEVDSFDPDQVPTIGTILREWNAVAAARKKAGGGLGLPGWEVTSLAPYVLMLERHCQPLMQLAIEQKRKSRAENKRIDF